jgi:O-6-methylguanine DNA methyltransferase
MRHAPAPVPLAVVTLSGPDGPFHVAASDVGVVAATGGWSRDGFEAALARRLGGRLTSETARARLASLLPALEAILDGRSTDLASVSVDLDDRPAFDRAVLMAVRDIPWGQTASYGEIARRVGAPRAAQAVGGAVGRCPIDVLIPCHRVIAANGTLGGYGGDGWGDRQEALRRKHALLLREGVTVHLHDR